MLQLESPDFADQGRIPRRFTGDGEDVSPQLRWSDLPAGTRELALLVEDPDAPRPSPYVHWVLYGLAPDLKGLPESLPKQDRVQEPAGVQGKNSSGKVGYMGPSPPKGHGPHHYHFHLIALDAPTGLQPGADAAALKRAIEGHVLGEADLVGIYERE